MKSFKLLASIAAISAVFGCASTAPSMTDGTYTGVGQGRNGELTVEVKVDAGKLSAVRVVKHVETVGISDAAVKQMPAAHRQTPRASRLTPSPAPRSRARASAPPWPTPSGRRAAIPPRSRRLS